MLIYLWLIRWRVSGYLFIDYPWYYILCEDIGDKGNFHNLAMKNVSWSMTNYWFMKHKSFIIDINKAINYNL